MIAAECTGCELCIAPCPVDCISMIPGKIARTRPVEWDVGIIDNCGDNVNREQTVLARVTGSGCRGSSAKKGKRKRDLRKTKQRKVADISAATDILKKQPFRLH